MKVIARTGLVCVLWCVQMSAMAAERAISSLGRLEPEGGIVQVAGPSGDSAVIKSLMVAEGDWVEEGQTIAYLDNYELRKTEVARLQAVQANAKSELTRQKNLSTTSATSKVVFDQAVMAMDVAQADLAAGRARLALAVIRAPLRAQVLEIHATAGERIGVEGVMELGKTDRMYVIAEVYETDIAMVKAGQAAVIKTTAVSEPLTGKVERVSLKVGRLDILGTDPIAKTDARVVEVYILLDDSTGVAGYTNLQVEVEIKI